jgi:hypothetical protein
MGIFARQNRPPAVLPPLLSGESRTRGLGKAQQNETRGSALRKNWTPDRSLGPSLRFGGLNTDSERTGFRNGIGQITTFCPAFAGMTTIIIPAARGGGYIHRWQGRRFKVRIIEWQKIFGEFINTGPPCCKTKAARGEKYWVPCCKAKGATSRGEPDGYGKLWR